VTQQYVDKISLLLVCDIQYQTNYIAHIHKQRNILLVCVKRMTKLTSRPSSLKSSKWCRWPHRPSMHISPFNC